VNTGWNISGMMSVDDGMSRGREGRERSRGGYPTADDSDAMAMAIAIDIHITITIPSTPPSFYHRDFHYVIT